MFETYNVKQSQDGHGTFSSVILPTYATKKGVYLTKIKHTNPKSTLPETNLSPENQWRFISFWGPAYFQGKNAGAFAVSFRECTRQSFVYP